MNNNDTVHCNTLCLITTHGRFICAYKKHNDTNMIKYSADDSSWKYCLNFVKIVLNLTEFWTFFFFRIKLELSDKIQSAGKSAQKYPDTYFWCRKKIQNEFRHFEKYSDKIQIILFHERYDNFVLFSLLSDQLKTCQHNKTLFSSIIWNDKSIQVISLLCLTSELFLIFYFNSYHSNQILKQIKVQPYIW